MKKLLLILLIFLSGFCLKSQTNLDSLYTVWQDETQIDSIRVVAFKDYIWDGFLYSNQDTAFQLAEEMIEFGIRKNYPRAEGIALNIQGKSWELKGDYSKSLGYYFKNLKIREDLNDQNGIAYCLSKIGYSYKKQGEYSNALEYYIKSLKIEEVLNSKEDIAYSLSNIGVIYQELGDYPSALEYHLENLKIKEDLNDQRGLSASLINIGNIYYYQGDFSKTLEYHLKSLKIYEELSDQRGIAIAFNNIGLVYDNLEDYPQALEYHFKSLKIRELLNDQNKISVSLSNIGSIYGDQGDQPTALKYHTQSLTIRRQIGDKRGIGKSLRHMGVIYRKQGKYIKALEHCNQSYSIAIKSGILEAQKRACSCLYETHKAMGNGNEALKYHERLTVLDDSLNIEETSKALQRMEFSKQVLADSLATVDKERLVQEAHQEEVRQKNQTRNALAGGGIFLFMIAAGIYGRLRDTRKSKAVLQTEKDRSENLLLNILPADIAAELKEKGRADARDFERVSILFTDFKGFTAASEKLSAQELVAEINTCFEAFDGIMGKCNIEKIKTIGDAYMAAGGLPVPTDGSVKNTVLAALEMQAFISKRKTTNDAANKPAFEMRVGIHTGPVVAGIVGVKKFAYDIWGDTVNTASRMESSGEVGQVNISQATYELLKEDPQLTFKSRGKIEAKGKGEIEMYFVSNT